MSSSFRRCDYAQVGTTSTRCLCVIRSDDAGEEGVSARSKTSNKKTKAQRDRVVVGSQNGILLCMERKQGGDTNVRNQWWPLDFIFYNFCRQWALITLQIVYKTPPGPPINCVQLGGALQTAQDKTFIAVGSQVKGFNRKGKQFLNWRSAGNFKKHTMSQLNQCPFEDGKSLWPTASTNSISLHLVKCAHYEDVYQSGVSKELQEAKKSAQYEGLPRVGMGTGGQQGDSVGLPGGGSGDGHAQREVGLPGGGMGTEDPALSEFDVYAVKLAADPKQPGDKDLLKAKLERVGEWQGTYKQFPTADLNKKKTSLKKAFDALDPEDDLKRMLYIGTSGVTLQVRVENELRDALLFWFLPHVPPYTSYLLVAMARIIDALGPKLLFSSYARYGPRNIEAYLLCGCENKKEGESREADCIYAYNPFTLANQMRPSLNKLYGSDVVPSEARKCGAKLIASALCGPPTTTFNPFALVPATSSRLNNNFATQLEKDLEAHGISAGDYRTVCNYSSFHEFQQSDIIKRLWSSDERVRGGKNRHLLPNPLRELLTKCKDEGVPRQSISNEDLAARMETMTDEELRFINERSGALLKSRTPTPGVKRKQHERGAEAADKDPGGTPKQRRD